MNNPYKIDLLVTSPVDEKIKFSGQIHPRTPLQETTVTHIYVGSILLSVFAAWLLFQYVNIHPLWRLSSLTLSLGTILFSLYSIVKHFTNSRNVFLEAYEPRTGSLDEVSLHIVSTNLQQEISLCSSAENRRLHRPFFWRSFIYLWDNTNLGRHVFQERDFQSREEYFRFRRRLEATIRSELSGLPRPQESIDPPRQILLPMPVSNATSQIRGLAPLHLPEFDQQTYGEGVIQQPDLKLESIQQAHSKRKFRILISTAIWTTNWMLMFSPSEMCWCCGSFFLLFGLISLFQDITQTFQKPWTLARYRIAVHPTGVAWATASTINQAKWVAFRSFQIEQETLLLETRSPGSYLIIPKRFFAAESDWRTTVQYVQQNLRPRSAVDADKTV